MKKLLSLIAVLVIGLTGCSNASTQFDEVLASIEDKSASYTYTTVWDDGTVVINSYDAENDVVTGDYSYGTETLTYQATGETVDSAKYNGVALSDSEIAQYVTDGTIYTSSGLQEVMLNDVAYIQDSYNIEYDVEITETDKDITATGFFENYDGSFVATITKEGPYVINYTESTTDGYQDTIVFE